MLTTFFLVYFSSYFIENPTTNLQPQGISCFSKHGFFCHTTASTLPRIPNFSMPCSYKAHRSSGQCDPELLQPTSPHSDVLQTIFTKGNPTHNDKVKPSLSIASQIYYVPLKVSSKVQESCEEVLPEFLPEHIRKQKMCIGQVCLVDRFSRHYKIFVRKMLIDWFLQTFGTDLTRGKTSDKSLPDSVQAS